jgi:hypothetical protein
VQGNIYERLLNAVQMVASSQNVVAYNFSTNNSGPNDFRRMSFDMAANHGAHNCMNLYEGNKIDKTFADAIHGSSSHFVYLRNWIRGFGTNNSAGYPTQMVYATTPVEMDWGNRFSSLVGNVLGLTNIDSGISWRSFVYMQTNPPTYVDFQTPGIYRIGYFNSAANDANRDTNVLYTLLLKDNLVGVSNQLYQVISTEVSGQSIPDSYYLASKPAWFSTWTWPPIGPYNTDRLGIIPAEARYYGLTAPNIVGTRAGAIPLY